MKANITPEEKQSMIQMVQTLDDNTLSILWKTITSNAGGISGMDPDLLQVFYDEFKKRPGLLESMTESRKRNKMKLTATQLRKAIRRTIKESMGLPSMDLELMRKLYDWVGINEEIGDPLPFLATIDSFLESEADAGNPMDGMEEEIHQSLNDLIDTGIIFGDNLNQENLGLMSDNWQAALSLLKEKGLL